MPLVEHTDETWRATLRRGIAMSCLTAGSHNHEWCVADEVLDIGSHVVLHFRDRPPIRVGITKLFGKTVGFNGYRHGASFPCTRCMSPWAVLVCRKARGGALLARNMPQTGAAAYGTAEAASRCKTVQSTAP